MGARFKPGAYEAKTIPLVLHVDVIILLLRLPLFTKAMTTKGDRMLQHRQNLRTSDLLETLRGVYSV